MVVVSGDFNTAHNDIDLKITLKIARHLALLDQRGIFSMNGSKPGSLTALELCIPNAEMSIVGGRIGQVFATEILAGESTIIFCVQTRQSG